MSASYTIIYESVAARFRGEPRAFWHRVLASGVRVSLIWLLVTGGAAALLLRGESEPAISVRRAVVVMAGAALFGLALGAFIESSGRSVYLHSSGLAIRQTAYRRLHVYPRQDIYIRRHTDRGVFQRVEVYLPPAKQPAETLWITPQDADRLEAWLEPAKGQTQKGGHPT